MQTIIATMYLGKSRMFGQGSKEYLPGVKRFYCYKQITTASGDSLRRVVLPLS